MSALKEFFEDKQAQKEWAEFVMAKLNEEILARTYAGKDVTGYKEAHDIIAASFKELNELFTPKVKREPKARSV